MSDRAVETIEERIDETGWSALAPHARRAGLFFVAPEIGLGTAGRAFALDRTAIVAQWLASGLLRRPTDDELRALDSAEPEARFRFLIVQPYVLVELRDTPRP